MSTSEATLPAGFPTATSTARTSGFRWTQLLMGIVCMAMIANLQYGWTLFVNPIADKHGWSRAAIQVAFTIFVLTETWLVPIEGYLVDRFGPRPVVMIGGILCGLGWVMNAYADSLTMLYIAAAVGGIGAGAVYGTCVGNALKWFPDRRGLAAGLTAAGFGAGSALTIVPIAAFIKSSGYEAAFLYFGIGQGLIVFFLSWFLARAPESKTMGVSTAAVQQTKRNYSPGEVLRNPVFWVMYAMFVMVAAGGLMATAQLGPIAQDFKIGDTPVTIMGLVLPALTFALAIDRVLNGLTRPFFGWVSDRIGREQTMFIAFALESVGILGLYTFGSKFAAANAGLLYTAKGTASLLVPLSSVLAAATGSWHMVFIVASAMNAIAALMAWFVLRPMRRRQMDLS
jgi:OFA family oxalate/formate antiporter-like MFS transporter